MGHEWENKESHEKGRSGVTRGEERRGRGGLGTTGHTTSLIGRGYLTEPWASHSYYAIEIINQPAHCPLCLFAWLLRWLQL